MVTKDVSLERMTVQLKAGNVGLGIAEMETYLAAWPNPQTSQKLDALKSEYELLADYWLRGAKDPMMEELYQKLLQRLYTLYANIAIYRHLQNTTFLHGIHTSVRSSGKRWSLEALRQEMEGFVSDVAMLELEAQHVRKEKSQELYQQHRQQMNALFNYVVTAHIWTDGIGQGMEELLLLPTIDSMDQQLLVSAITLSLMNCFDLVKFRTLVNVCRKSDDEAVRQRALVGWVLGIDDDCLKVFPEMRELTAQVLQSEEICNELIELQLQLVYLLNSEKVTTTMQQEIMPDLMKNNVFRVTDHGIEETEEDPMEDILHPGAAEERMEKLEAAYRRMLDMERQGADIFFSGFSQMKRFPFFYDMSNWLVPFYIEHPDIRNYVETIGQNRLVEKLLTRRAFCNSDKYSLVMVMRQVMNKLPEKLLEMLKQGEVDLDEMDDEEMSELKEQAASIRRGYLMDLYRFFQLFPNRSAMRNPFEAPEGQLSQSLFFGSTLFAGTPIEQHKREVVSLLLKQKMTAWADRLLATFPPEMHDVQYFLWMEDYESALALDHTNERALVGFARSLFKRGRYQQAGRMYDILMRHHPGRRSYMLNKAVCLVHTAAYEEALVLLYQLNYEHGDDDKVLRVLAWTQTCQGRLEQATEHYRQLTTRDAAMPDDFLNQGYCLWLMGRTHDAADSFRKYLGMTDTHADSPTLSFDREWLLARGIDELDIKMMQAEIEK